MRAVTTVVSIIGLGLPLTGATAAQTQLKISPSLHLKKPNNECFAASFVVQQGKYRFMIMGKCRGIALVCAYRTPTTKWACEKPPLAVGQKWLWPYPAEPASVYYVGACRSDNSDCTQTLDQLYPMIADEPRPLDPAKVDPPTPVLCNGLNCPPPPPPPPPPAPERG